MVMATSTPEDLDSDNSEGDDTAEGINDCDSDGTRISSIQTNVLKVLSFLVVSLLTVMVSTTHLKFRELEIIRVMYYKYSTAGVTCFSSYRLPK